MGSKGWLGIYLDTRSMEWAMVESLVEESYRLIAPKRLAATPTPSREAPRLEKKRGQEAAAKKKGSKKKAAKRKPAKKKAKKKLSK